MKLSNQHLLCLLLAVLCATKVEAFLFDLSIFESLINNVFLFMGSLGLWNVLAQNLCSAFEGVLPETLVGCQCSGSFSIPKGLGGEFFCQLGGETCLVNGEKKDEDDLFCGIATVEAAFAGETGFETLEICFEVESGLPSSNLIDDLLYICIEAIPLPDVFRLFEFSECGIKINDRRCNSCTVCEGNRDFRFDCSNIDFNAIGVGGFIPGPIVSSCFGFGAFFGIFDLLGGGGDRA